jgi:hypothetical protein
MIIYMAHPVHPAEGETVESNLELALAWLKYCHQRFPAWTVFAPWIPDCEIYDDSDPEQRHAGIERNRRVVRVCDGVILVGLRISSGMRAEARESFASGGQVFSLAYAGIRHPHDGADDIELRPVVEDRFGSYPAVLEY